MELTSDTLLELVPAATWWFVNLDNWLVDTDRIVELLISHALCTIVALPGIRTAHPLVVVASMFIVPGTSRPGTLWPQAGARRSAHRSAQLQLFLWMDLCHYSSGSEKLGRRLLYLFYFLHYIQYIRVITNESDK